MNWFDGLPPTLGRKPVILVDGGGSGSLAIAADSSGRVLSCVNGPATNSRSTGDRKTVENIGALVSECAQAAAIDLAGLGSCVVATAGINTSPQAAALASALKSELLHATHVSVVPDSLASCAGAGDLGAAMAVISGTGSVVAVANFETRDYLTFGGWDFLLGDFGSGFALGRAAARTALAYSEGLSGDEEVAQMCLRTLGISAYAEIVDALHKPSVDKAYVASVAEPLLRQAKMGVPGAQRIVREEASQLACIASQVHDRFAHWGLSVGYFGGVLHDDYFRAEFAGKFNPKSFSGVPSLNDRTTALAGCLRLAGLNSTGVAELNSIAASFELQARDFVKKNTGSQQ